ncbi:MAG: hypothetical protein A3G43_06475 [Ignavibacteria bacterium RIFCSPLOWO2_12_FULL_56_21]|nr:MAG: hypothetical protein A3G43_06475 [Ignavibacteria bacterium RIFCSPLOWO2_12_FULL_56_21]
MLRQRIHRAAVTVLFAAAILDAQVAVRWDARRPLAPYRQLTAARTAAVDTLRLLGVMVEFDYEEVDDGRTAGTGRFDTSTTHPAVIDPPPHNAAFFEAKMSFVRNYFARASDSLLFIDGDVLPSPVTVSKRMADYSQDNAPSFRGLARLAVESWMEADTAFPAVDFSAYDAFVLFHAGTGKDIDLVGLFGYDPAPYDVPSVYLGLEALRTALDSAAFDGIRVRNGTVLIRNTMILPETESRVYATSGTNDTLEISFNGLFAASIGSHLGLPDLFDTQTGASGIGQHGLMDGASFFAFRGLFPPEPSAWEKIALGWVEPIMVTSPIDTIILPAVGSTKKDSIYKVPISNTEYFLVENRARDLLPKGQLLTIMRKNVLYPLYIPYDSLNYFMYDDVRAVDGSVVDVVDLDWALVGFITSAGRFDGGGTLIWHIDEDVIAARMASNSVNAGSGVHGVVLMEADGSQDISQNYSSFEGGSGSEVGTPFDPWFLGNDSPVYANRFDDTSFPNSRTNAGAASLVTIRDFSARGPRMTAVVEFGSTRASSLSGFPKYIAGVPGPAIPFDIDGDGWSEIFTTRTRKSGPDGRTGSPTGSGEVLGWTSSGTGVLPLSDSSGVVARIDSAVIGRLSAGRIPGSSLSVFAACGTAQLTVWNGQDLNLDSLLDVRFSVSLSPDTAAWLVLLSDTLVIAYGPPGVSVFGLSGTLLANFPSGATHIVWTGTQHQFYSALGSSLRTLGENLPGDPFVLGSPAIEMGGTIMGLAAARTGSGSPSIVALSTGIAGASRVTVVDGGAGTVSATFDLGQYLKTGEEVLATLMLADRDRDGKKDVVVSTSMGRIVAASLSGVLLDRSPDVVSHAGGWTSVDLLAAELDGSGKTTVVTAGADGIVRFNTSGADVGFQASNRVAMSAAFASVPSGVTSSLGLFVTDVAGGMNAWDLRTPYDSTKVLWAMRGGDASGSGLSMIATSSAAPLGSGVLPKDRVYNWPNPVYGKQTLIRLYSEWDGEVVITIYDVAGDRVTELRGRSLAGQDVEIPWDVSGIQSGVYMARVALNTVGGSGVAIIKIAVVK